MGGGTLDRPWPARPPARPAPGVTPPVGAVRRPARRRGSFVGGGIGTLLVIGAVFAVLDAVVPIPRSPQAEAEDRFARLARSRRKRGRRSSTVVDEGSAPLAAAPRRGPPRRPADPDRVDHRDDRGVEGAAVRPRLPPRPLDRGALEVAVDGRRRAGWTCRPWPSTGSASATCCATATTACRWRSTTAADEIEADVVEAQNQPLDFFFAAPADSTLSGAVASPFIQ